MDIRHPANPRDFESYTTERIREEFLVQNLFVPGAANLTYSFIDRMIVGGICPDRPLALETKTSPVRPVPAHAPPGCQFSDSC